MNWSFLAFQSTTNCLPLKPHPFMLLLGTRVPFYVFSHPVVKCIVSACCMQRIIMLMRLLLLFNLLVWWSGNVNIPSNCPHRHHLTGWPINNGHLFRSISIPRPPPQKARGIECKQRKKKLKNYYHLCWFPCQLFNGWPMSMKFFVVLVPLEIVPMQLL